MSNPLKCVIDMGEYLHNNIQQRTEELIRAASDARKQAYAPYSKFRIGAAVLTTNGKIFTGCNVENVSYGLSICAERVAVGNMAASGEREIAAVAVFSNGGVFPCGACLQVIQEFSGKEPPLIIAAGTDGSVQMKSLDQCLPCAFKDFEGEGQEVIG